MGEEIFTGKFLKPAEAFVLQNLDPTHLNRLTPSVLLWLVVLTVAGLAIHFLLQALPGFVRKKEQR
jgi:hypothetical protein